MTSEMGRWLRSQADHYKITVEEASRRYKAVIDQGDNPNDPICVGCAKRPDELPCYTEMVALDEEYTSAVDYVVEQEGTYNPENGHFLCDHCYIINGMPSSPSGWKAP